MPYKQKSITNSIDLTERCELLEEKNRALASRIRTLSEENRANENLLNVLLEFTPFGTVLFDKKRRVIRMNKAAETILGLERVNAIGKNCESVFHCYVDRHQCPLTEENKNLDRIETICQKGKSSSQNTLLRSAVKIDTNGESVLVEAFVDISAIKQAQQEIENANSTKNNFLAKVSHELRTPLNAIIGFTQLLQDSFANNPELAETQYLNNILRSSKKLQRMVDEILDITRITAGKLQLDEYQIDIPSLINQFHEDMAELYQEQNNTLEIVYADGVKLFYADPARLYQVLYHLIENAGLYTRHGRVVVNIAQESHDGAEWLAFHVRDNGEGMDEEQLKRVFNEFEQADTGNTRRHGGAGLGLSLCESISALMGGMMKITSLPGQGTEVTLLLPVKEPEETA